MSEEQPLAVGDAIFVGNGFGAVIGIVQDRALVLFQSGQTVVFKASDAEAFREVLKRYEAGVQ